MATPSHDDGEAQAEFELPVAFDRKCKPWRYSVTHSELEIRSIERPGSPDVLVVKFYGVIAMKIRTYYDPITPELASGAELSEMVRFAGVDEAFRRKFHRAAIPRFFQASWHTTGTGAFPSATAHRFW